MTQFIRSLLIAIGAALLVLVATGVHLLFFYTPTSAHSATGRWEEASRTVHRVDSLILIALLIVLIGALGWSRRPRVFVGIAMAGAAFASVYTGSKLPWDQVGLWAVTVGEDLRGYRAFVDGSSLRFAFIDGEQVAPGTVLRWLVVHVVCGAALLLGFVLMSRRSHQIDPLSLPDAPDDDLPIFDLEPS